MQTYTRLLAMLLVSMLVTAAYAQTGPVNVEVVQDLQRLAPLPSVALPPGDPATYQITEEANHRFGFDKHDSLGFSIQPGEDPNDVYKDLFPFPLLRVMYVRPQEPLNDAGPVQSILAWHYVYPAAEDFQHKAAKEIKDWNWEVPAPLRDRKASLTESIYKDPYGALCLSDSDGKANPQLFSFDNATGLRWQSEIPLREALVQYGRLVNKPIEAESSIDVSTAVSHTGARTLVEIGWRKPWVTLVFFYDAQGALSRTLAFAEYRPASMIIYRTLTTDRFGVLLERKSEEQAAKRAHHDYPGVSFLMDMQGRLQGRFGGDDSYVINLSDTYARVRRREKDQYVFDIYALPGTPAVEAKSVPPQR